MMSSKSSGVPKTLCAAVVAVVGVGLVVGAITREGVMFWLQASAISEARQRSGASCVATDLG
jgi:hypothetical protein